MAMGVGVSIFTITLGAILKFAISPTAMTSPVDVHVIGVILMIVGGVSFLLQFLLSSFAFINIRQRKIPTLDLSLVVAHRVATSQKPAITSVTFV